MKMLMAVIGIVLLSLGFLMQHNATPSFTDGMNKCREYYSNSTLDTTSFLVCANSVNKSYDQKRTLAIVLIAVGGAAFVSSYYVGRKPH